MSKIKLTKVNVDLFRDFLTKLSNFEKNVFIKIGKERVTSHVYFPNKDAVKVAELSTDDIFEFAKPLTEDIKVAFYNAKDIIAALSFFTSDNTSGEIEYSEEDDGNSAISFKLKSDQETFKLFCLDPNFSFIDMGDDEVDVVFETTELNDDDESDQIYFANFELDHEMIKKIESRLKINKDESKFTFKIDDGKVYIVTKNNELLISDDVEIISEDMESVTLFKKYLNLLDKENYRIFLCSNKLIFESSISDTKLAIAASVDEDDLDDMEDLNDEDLDGDLKDLDNLPIDL